MPDINEERVIFEPDEGFEELTRDGRTYLAVAKYHELLDYKGVRIQFTEDLDKQFALFKINDNLYCLDNICPHRHAERIYEGLIKKDKLTVTCPLHGWTYSMETGENVNKLQGLKSLKRYEAFEENGIVYVEKVDFKPPKWRR